MARTIKEKHCAHLAEKKSERSFLCGVVGEDHRRNVFRYFWSLPSWDAKKAYIKGLVRLRSNSIRRRSTSTNIKKKHQYDCYIPSDNDQRVRVCKDFFLGTFNLNKNIFESWLKVHDKKVLRKNTTSEKSDSVRKWLDTIPKIPSHYCRSNTKRIYVEDQFKSKTNMQKIYAEWCKNNDEVPAMRKKFCTVLDEEKISIFKPRKDQCDVCVGYTEGNFNEEEYLLHKTKKDEARAAKQLAVNNVSPEVMVVTMDMQSVLLCPKLLVSEQYYKSKLAVHNFTFYIKNTKDAHLYIWHKGEGWVTANNITSCIIHFLKEHCLTFKKVVLISDGCLYQNKNKILSSALANLNSATGLEIEQLILEKGHTMMEVDSVHSTLERAFNPPIYTPMDYVSRMRQARTSQPYIVNYLEFSFFKDYEHVPGNFKSIRPGKDTGEATVNSIRALLYKQNEVKFKTRHSEDWSILTQKRNKTIAHGEVKPLYEVPPKIENAKYKSLQSLKKYMHKDFHAFYDNLNH